MQVTGIIAEYNPFHKGHEYHLKEARRQTGADFLFVVMGGNFMQRGEPSLVDKFARTKMALLGGADLVAELPTPFATGSAEFFARGAIELLHSSGIVHTLCFGSEAGNLDLMKTTARILVEEPPVYQKVLKEKMKAGCSFPAAREQAINACLHLALPETQEFFSSPNNILGIEYLKALFKKNSRITPYTILRKGSYHGESFSQALSCSSKKEPDSSFASASDVRKILKNSNREDCWKLLTPHLPETTLSILKSQERFVDLEDFASALHYRLLTASSPLDFSVYLDVTPDLSRRIFSLRHQFSGYNQFINLVKTRQYTRTRIARSLLHILLGISAEETELPRAIRILGFKKSAAPLLKELQEKSTLPLVTKATDQELFSREIFYSNLYHLGYPYHELSRPLIIL